MAFDLRHHLLLWLVALSACSIIVINAAEPVDDKKLLVTLYYESLCPYSVLFITDQLNPSYEAFKDFVNVVFVPFGKSESHHNGTTNSTTFTCQHEAAECRENMLQTCALHQLHDRPDEQMLYVACQMNKTVDHTGEECVRKQSTLSWTEVQECLAGDLGVRLQLEAEQQTHRVRVPYPEFVPCVTFDDIYDKDVAMQATENFARVVCQRIDNQASVCNMP